MVEESQSSVGNNPEPPFDKDPRLQGPGYVDFGLAGRHLPARRPIFPLEEAGVWLDRGLINFSEDGAQHRVGSS